MAFEVSEARMHGIRWILTSAWLLIIVSLFYDPWTPRFTEADHPWSPLRLGDGCVDVQGVCLRETPYPLGTTVFWGVVVPAAVLILLLFGHELWRRICPLSFLSQIPRALGWQRQRTKVNPRTGERRQQLAKVSGDSWLARHYSQLQFGWLFVGLCGRILFFNADRLVLAGWLLFTIAAAIGVGWLYGGKAWCQYFCPMAPVQSVYSTPAGLLGSKAHLSEKPITQSMCRTVLADGSEQSACVACQQPCIDIDAERMYWSRLGTREFSFERYAYVGLVVGYFLYYYLYAGSWEYYFSGAWVRQSDQLSLLLRPGLFLFGQSVNVPRLVAVPLVLGFFTWLGVRVGRWIERDSRMERHQIFVLATFLVFNFFFLFSGRPLLLLLPGWVQTLFDAVVVGVSSLWLYRSWERSADLHQRENLASRFRRQLQKLDLDVGRYLDGRQLADLSPHEVYVLAKVLPSFTREKRQQVYKGVVREALQEGYTNASSSLEVLRQMRREIGITDEEHGLLLETVGVENPDLLDPDGRRSLEDQIRLSGYSKSLERLMTLKSRQADPETIRHLRNQYSITPEEEASVLEGLAPPTDGLQKLEAMLPRFSELRKARRSLLQPSLADQPLVRDLLAESLLQRQDLSVRAMLGVLCELKDQPEALEWAARLQALRPVNLLLVLAEDGWEEQLSAPVLAILQQKPNGGSVGPTSLSRADTLASLEGLLQERTPLLRAGALFLLARLDPGRARFLVSDLEPSAAPVPLSEVLRALAEPSAPLPELHDLPELEMRAHLAASDFFRGTSHASLEQLAAVSELRRFGAGELITETGDTCRELLLLISGKAAVQYQEAGGIRLDPLKPGQVLDELEVLSHSASENTIVAEEEGTRLLAVPVDGFDAVLERDPDFARRVLQLESRHLQSLMRSLQS
ncbi:cyclic nucleotide-binding domain-containing protein [Synechococcus sp. BSF8S]|uniref:cyclic nucleotide-binding domain-containing protein n=2 Tax=Synechococcales TaxID=1890424 RepID=UPI001629CAF7|nr:MULTISPECIES: cyclic nucleotide-binding domain-containing protein [unclassified Synechococcus]MBC1262131.1 cyclic nucleotide-binding domain-containing protein [Synechococcus sp. BSF8S]MBC1265058.1 cyclic nucleotide-binding domain-containing protein [Synechococcus sp. BSA11S]